VVGGDDGEIRDAGGGDEFGGGTFADHGLVKRLPLEVAKAEGAGGVSLGVDVGEKDAGAAFGQCGGEIDGGGGFTHSALLVGDGDDFHRGRLE
jgi:hypothetical protein